MNTYTIDTNAGPIVRRDFRDLDAAKEWAISMCPLAQRRGYTVEWYPLITWHVARIINTKGRIMHRLAVRQDGATLPRCDPLRQEHLREERTMRKTNVIDTTKPHCENCGSHDYEDLHTGRPGVHRLLQ